VQATAIPTRDVSTIIPTLVISSTEVPTLTPSPTPSSWTSSGSAVIQTGVRTCANSEQLRSGIHTLEAEKKIEITASRGTGSEIWRLIFREPNDCLIEVFTNQRKLVRTSYYHGLRLRIDAGKVKQDLQTSTPQAWTQVLQFFSLNSKYDDTTEYREIFPGAWIPNAFGFISKNKNGFGVSNRINFTGVNQNVDQEFSKLGY
jgi:hypothetical protein